MKREIEKQIEKIKETISETGVTVVVLESVEKTLRRWPDSDELWCLRGDLIQLCEGETDYDLADVFCSYQNAVVINPHSAEAHESLGYFYDVFENEFEKAESAFRQAIEFGAGADSFLGLARVLAQAGKSEEALNLLSGCPFCDEVKVENLKHDIKSGGWDSNEG